MLNPRRVDEHFEWQYALASQSHPVVLVDWDHPAREGRRGAAGSLDSRLRIRGTLDADRFVYRGWILTDQEYARLEQAVTAGGSSLLTGAEAYARGQYLPLWYPQFSELTPASIWVDQDASDTELLDAADRLGARSFVIKDSAKSLKHEWAKACFASDRRAVPEVVHNFRELSEHTIYGSIVVREFEDWSSGEIRLWWVHGELAAVTAHPDSPGHHDRLDAAEIDSIRAGVRRLGCPFVATDLVRSTSGTLRLVEVGDGQVCDIPHEEARWLDVLDAFG